jgi:hypothetical protein
VPPSSLRLILCRMWQRPVVLEHLTEITAVDPATTGRTSDEMLRFVPRWIANAFAEVFSARNIGHRGRPLSERAPVGRRLPGHRVYEVDPGTGGASYRNVGLAIVGGVVKANLYIHGFRGTSIDYRSHEPGSAR